MNKIRATAQHLYLFLQDKPVSVVKELLDRLLNVYGVEDSARKNLRRSTMRIIEEHFDFKVDSSTEGVQPEDTFYRKYILYQPLHHLKGSERIKTGCTPLLKPILTKLQEA